MKPASHGSFTTIKVQHTNDYRGFNLTSFTFAVGAHANDGLSENKAGMEVKALQEHAGIEVFMAAYGRV